jgi:hypothetical protein
MKLIPSKKFILFKESLDKKIGKTYWYKLKKEYEYKYSLNGAIYYHYYCPDFLENINKEPFLLCKDINSISITSINKVYTPYKNNDNEIECFWQHSNFAQEFEPFDFEISKQLEFDW